MIWNFGNVISSPATKSENWDWLEIVYVPSCSKEENFLTHYQQIWKKSTHLLILDGKMENRGHF